MSKIVLLISINELGIAILLFLDPARICNTEIPVLRRPNSELFSIGVERE